MAEAGIGVDIVEVSHMETVLQKTPSFAERFFTPDEVRYCERFSRPIARYASLFAAREAVLKSLGVGYGHGVGRKDISIAFDERDRPIVLLSGGAASIAEELDVVEVALSLSISGDLAVANAMAITSEARPKPKIEPEDERTRIARSFHDARLVLDDLDRAQEHGLIASPGTSTGTVRKDDDEASFEH